MAVIGTGSSGIQSIPIIAEQAAHLYVFQRTPNYSIPAGNRPLSTEEMDDIKAGYAERRRLSWRSGGGSPHITASRPTMEFTPEERRAAYEKRWQLGGVLYSKTFPDQTTDMTANDEARKFYEEKIRAIIDDPATADLLIPNDHPIGTKRICTDSNYFQTFNRSNVSLISVRATPIESVDAAGINTTDAHYDLDAIVLATGFDALTGALARIDIVGRDGAMLRDHWEHGPRTYLGLGVDGFPNLFVISGPGAPAVLANMVLHAEAHVNWIADAIAHLDDHGYAAMEPTRDAVDGWVARIGPTGRRVPVHQSQLVVPGRQCSWKAAGFHAVHRWLRDVQRHLRGGCRRRLQGLRTDQDVVMTGLLDKVVVVTGAARGTGRTHCTRFADEGADVIALDFADAASELHDLATEIERRGRRCATGLADVSDLDAVTAAVDAGVAQLGRLDVVVANAGVHLPGAPSWELDPQLWQRTLDINLTGVWHTVKAGVPHIGDDGGSVIIISSTSGIRGLPNTAHYTASKHAVVGLARTLANELGPRRIRVNTVHPGPVATPMVLNEATFRRLRPDLTNPTAADAAEVLMARNLLPVPWVEPVDIANAVVFLASDQARYITGTQLVVDAGLTQKTT